MIDEILAEIHAIKDEHGSRFITVAGLARELAREERASTFRGRELIPLLAHGVKPARAKAAPRRPAVRAKAVA